MSKMIAAVLVGLVVTVARTAASGQVQIVQEQPPPSIAVRGHAEVRVPPDLVSIRMGTVVQQPQAEAAQAQVNQAMQRAIQAISKLGLSASQIQTSGISLAPVYTTAPPPGTTQTPLEPRIVAYRASNAVDIRMENLQLVGQVIDAAVAAGANQVEGLSFQLKDDSPPRQQALFEASRQARAKAQSIADALGVRIAGVQQVQEAGVEVIHPTTFTRQAAFTEAASPTSVQPGEVRVEANVVVTYQINGILVTSPTTRPAEPTGETSSTTQD